jgi:hypothetical protein
MQKVRPRFGYVILHFLAATILCSASAGLLGGATYWFAKLAGSRISAETPMEFFSDHIVFFTFATGILAGWFNNWKFPHYLAWWMWVIPTVLLVVRVVSWHGYGVFEDPWRAMGSHFFGDSCRLPYSLGQLGSGGAYCFDQLQFTGPFCSSVAYSIGARVSTFSTRGLDQENGGAEHRE